MNQQPQHQNDTFRPLSVTIVFIAVLGWSTYTLFQWGRMGFGWGTCMSLITGVLCIRQVIRLCDDAAKLRAYRARIAAFRGAAASQGTSEFGSPDDARAAGLHGRGGR